MKQKQIVFLCVVFFLAVICVPTPVLAITRVVDPVSTTCDSTASPPCYRTITAAVAGSVAGDTIDVKSGSYGENVTIGINLTLRGTETAGTLLSGGNGTVFSVTNGSTLSVANFTFQDTAIGIDVSGTATVNAYNNIFLGITNKAVQLLSTPVSAPVIINNVFQQNNTAISTNAAFLIKNNIFTGNALAIDSVDATTTNITHNCFFSNTQNGRTGDTTTNVTSDPLYANAGQGDFHLQTGSPCIDAGDPALIYNDPAFYPNSRNDIGAYGGPLTDTIPFPVSGVTATPLNSTTVRVNWSPNLSYLVIGYNVYSDTSPGTHGTKKDAGTTRPSDVTGLTPVGTPPAAPTLAEPMEFANQTLKPVWNFVSGATGYKLHYGIGSTAENTIDVGNVNTYTLQGLTNGVTYMVAVSSYAQATYYFSVTAYNSTTSTPGVSQESAYSSEVPVAVGAALESGLSNIVEQYPEAINAYPNLPNKGCFIATAAYGHYSAPQVRALRKFRDEYLLTNEAGRAFVRWYYEQGPRAARFIDEHPSLKPVVRTVLLPAVAGAMFITGTSGPVKTIAAFCLMVGIGYFLFRRKLGRAGGRQ